MKYTILYKRSVEKDFRKFPNVEERRKLKLEVDSLLTENPVQGKKLRGRYAGLYSLHIRHKVIVVYKIFPDTVLVLAVESREGSYKKPYE